MEQNCPYCKSKYTRRISVGVDLADIYVCHSCKMQFTFDGNKDAVRGTWLMTFYNDSIEGQKVELYRDDAGIFYANQKVDHKFISGSPRVQIYATPTNRDKSNYGVFISTFQADTDPKGVDFRVYRIEMSPSMTVLAKQNAAMRAVFDRDNTFCPVNDSSKELNEDIAVFLRAATGAEDQTRLSKTLAGCYVATAVYGSYDCPQVWTLRRFRDNTLAQSWYGRGFICLYYAVSPTLVKWFGKTQWFKNLWKPSLDRMVKRLNENGVEDTPYDDRVW